MRNATDTIFSGVTAAGNNNSDAVQVELQFGYSVCATISTTGTGSVKLQASIDGTTYVDVASSSQAFTVPTSLFWNVSDVYYRYFRVVVVVSTGTPTAVVKFFSKGY